PFVAETKPVLDLLDPLPALTAEQIALAQWLARETLSPLAACIGLMLPSGLSQQADVFYQTLDRGPRTVKNGLPSAVHGQTAARLLELLETRGPLRGRQIDRHFKNVDWRKVAQYLVRTGVLTSQSILPPISVRPKFVRTAQLAVPPEQAEAAMPELGKTADTLSRRQAALRFLMREPADVNVSWVYAESGCNLADLQELAERELIVLRETEIWRDPLEKLGNQESGNKGLGTQELEWQGLTLTIEQEEALNQILQAFQPQLPNYLIPNHPFLLHGVTGSGKTEIYIRAAQECIRRGKQSIILVPEIALTPQTVRRFLARFPGQVGLVHSRLSEGERYDTWRRARLGQLKVIIGPRSALFAPLPNVGLIVADECHDTSYYQSEPPFYNAVRTAQEYARICGGVCILGSATPTIQQRYQASSPQGTECGGGVRLLELPKRIQTSEFSENFGGLPPVSIIDMREELKSGNRGVFSQTLVDALDDVLKKGQQAILFLNRRGTATYIFCRECGTAVRCPRCDTPLTYHSPAETLSCHRCGYTRQMPKKCPVCGSDQIRQYGLGSQKVEAEVGALFPSARTLRWDWDTTRQKDSHEIILSHFTTHRADVLIGTQMLAKGLDLPLVTLVGIVLADVGLNLPDPFAAERTFDVLTQVSGRAGRSSLGGRVVLQTFQPEHYVIQAAAGQDYAAFYARELDYRRQLGYPPFNRLVRMEYRHVQATKAESEAQGLAAKLAKWIESEDRRETTIIGPAPCFFSRLNGLYRWQIILRGPNPASLLRRKGFEGAALSGAPSLSRGASKGWRVEVDPVSLL
ncbi:MAG: primosomal protein N', partial [Candidatus Atribacteria bacterium]|nr:primosomal protein N' [Candidatus Atribacteria bacterium]